MPSVDQLSNVTANAVFQDNSQTTAKTTTIIVTPEFNHDQSANAIDNSCKIVNQVYDSNLKNDPSGTVSFAVSQPNVNLNELSKPKHEMKLTNKVTSNVVDFKQINDITNINTPSNKHQNLTHASAETVNSHENQTSIHPPAQKTKSYKYLYPANDAPFKLNFVQRIKASFDFFINFKKRHVSYFEGVNKIKQNKKQIDEQLQQINENKNEIKKYLDLRTTRKNILADLQKNVNEQLDQSELIDRNIKTQQIEYEQMLNMFSDKNHEFEKRKVEITNQKSELNNLHRSISNAHRFLENARDCFKGIKKEISVLVQNSTFAQETLDMNKEKIKNLQKQEEALQKSVSALERKNINLTIENEAKMKAAYILDLDAIQRTIGFLNGKPEKIESLNSLKHWEERVKESGDLNIRIMDQTKESQSLAKLINQQRLELHNINEEGKLSISLGKLIHVRTAELATLNQKISTNRIYLIELENIAAKRNGGFIDDENTIDLQESTIHVNSREDSYQDYDTPRNIHVNSREDSDRDYDTPRNIHVNSREDSDSDYDIPIDNTSRLFDGQSVNVSS